MLAVVQFPIADARGFLNEPLGRLEIPDWPAPRTHVNPQFVRRFGPAVERQGRADRAWVDEHSFCRASRAIRFVGMPASMGPRSAGFAPKCAFRRLFVDGSGVVARVEVGIAHDRRRGRPRIDEPSCLAIVSDLLRLRTRVPQEEARDRPLLLQGQHLARLYRRATTKNGVPANPNDARIVEDGRPLVVVELEPGELEGPLEETRGVDPARVGGADLAFARLRLDWGPIGVWLLRPGTASRGSLRGLRLCLLRLHAERECLGMVINEVRRGIVTFDTPGAARDRLDRFLNDATKLILKEKWSDHSQSAIREAFDAATDLAEPDEAADLSQRLEGARRQVAAKVQEYARYLSAPRSYEVVEVEGDYVKNEVNISRSTVTNSNVIAAARMGNVLNSFRQTDASDELKQAITDLHAEAAKLIERVNDEKTVTAIEKRVELLTDQARESEPLEDIVRAAGNGLIQAGQLVSDMAEPIAGAVKRVLSLLKIALI